MADVRRQKSAGYQKLKVWQDAVDLVVDIYKVVSTFPSSERYGLVSQMQRAATSIPANIAEGHGRETDKAFAQFLRIAQGSLRELETHIVVSERLDIIHPDDATKLLNCTDELSRMLYVLIRNKTR